VYFTYLLVTIHINRVLQGGKKAMNFGLTREQELVRQMVREFAVNEVKPIAAEIDETERFPMENVKKMAELGMMGIPFPKELGGAGGDVLSYIITVEELSKVCGTTGVIVSAHTSLCASLLYENGTPSQKEKYLIPLAKGEKIGAFGLTEPGAGTDAAGQQTTAVLDGDNYILNGSKIFITNGGVADTFIVFAMTDKSQGTRGISAFIVEKDFPGFSIGKKEDKLGIRASSTTELIFENCVVPKENLIGKEGKGFGIAMKTLDGGRIGIAAQALGIAEGAYEEAVKYMKERKQFGRPLSAFQGLQWMIAEMETKIEAAKLLVYKAAWLKQNKLPYSVDAAKAKLFAAEVAMDVTTKAVQIHGGYGYTKEYPVERMMRDAKITEIYEGTSEVQKMVIAGAALR
jgi:butyryl-CoA dehydrogenase